MDDTLTKTNVTAAVIRIPYPAMDSLDLLKNFYSGNKPMVEFLQAMQQFRLRQHNQDWFQVDDFSDSFDFTYRYIQKKLQEIRKDYPDILESKPANQLFLVDNHRLLMHEFCPYYSIPDYQKVSKEAAHTAQSNQLVGRARGNAIRAALTELGVEKPNREISELEETNVNIITYPEELNSAELLFTESKKICSILAPGESLKDTYDGITVEEGIPQHQRATSMYGVVNDYDSYIIRIMQDLTLKYLSAYPNLPTDPLARSRILVPIWIEDIAFELGLSRSPTVLKKINESIIRIYFTTIKTMNRRGLSDELNSFGPNAPHIRLINQFYIILPNEAISQTPILNIGETSSIKERYDRDYNYTFSTVAMSWDADFYKTISDEDKTSIQSYNTDLSKIPLFLRKVYEFWRGEHKRQKPELYTGQGTEVSIVSMINGIWHFLEEKEIHNMVRNMLSALRLVCNPTQRNKDLYQSILLRHTVHSFAHHTVSLNLFGVHVTFDIPRFDDQRVKANYETLVTVSIDDKDLVEKAGAQYNEGRNNQPNLPNPFKIKKSKSAKELVNRRLPSIVNSVTESLKLTQNKYSISFPVNDDEIFFSRYTDITVMQSKLKYVAEVKNLSVNDLELFFIHKIGKLENLPYIGADFMQELSRIFDISTPNLVRFFSRRVPYLIDNPDHIVHMVRSNLAKF